SSRRRHTRSKRDWSSDVCSSDPGQPLAVLAKSHALANGCLEAILLNSGGFACSTTEGNLFAVRGGEVLRFPSWPADAVAEVVSEIGRASWREGGGRGGGKGVVEG